MFSHTIIIIIITVIVSLLAWQNKNLFDRLIFYPPAIKQGQWDRFLTHGFIHADSMHLLFNMFTLYFFGKAIESLYSNFLGGYGFVAMYLLAIIVAIIPSYLKNQNNPRYLSLGASGGVSAVLFAYILIAPWSTLYLFAVLPIPAIIFAIAYVGYSIYADKKGNSNINHLAHLWGGAFGVIATIALEPSIIPHFINALLHPSF
ncbi:rhomboid family intramembrane serine protease [Psychrobacter sp. I-STPA10]|uniref:rhomboid family intramembrane serine protease n=1 Tax=Psychrobacter sp. I-STPA10 TaxID=2585769 RepID=UPI001E59740F|nr:rhomboid family intramembrane serine protease [Psychrobacter sp. I-STPA10]